jgi:hypothetical protein
MPQVVGIRALSIEEIERRARQHRGSRPVMLPPKTEQKYRCVGGCGRATRKVNKHAAADGFCRFCKHRSTRETSRETDIRRGN